MRITVIDELNHDARVLQNLIGFRIEKLQVEWEIINAWHHIDSSEISDMGSCLLIGKASQLLIPENEVQIQELVRKGLKIVVYHTDDSYGIQCIKLGIFDYLKFPFDPQEIDNFIARILQINSDSKSDCNMVIRDMRGTQVIPLSSIKYIEAQGAYSKIICYDRELLVCRTMKSLCNELDGPFIRIHRSYMVNVKLIDHFTVNTLNLTCQRKLPVSRTGRARLLMELPQQNTLGHRKLELASVFN